MKTKPEVSLELRPEMANACHGGTINFQTFLVSCAGQVALQHGVTYISSDGSILTVNSTTGVGTVVGTGIVTITAAWQGLIAQAVAKCTESTGNCCAETQVRIVVLGDESKSMHEGFGFMKKRDLAYGILQRALSPLASPAILSARTLAATVLFSDAPELYAPFTDDPTQTIYPQSLSTLAPELRDMPGKSDISKALDMALDTLAEQGSVNQQVVILFSDGIHRPDEPKKSGMDKQSLRFSAEQFREGGGVIIIFGIGATREGFELLQGMASPGYFVNIIPPLGSDVISVNADKLSTMLCWLCANERLIGPDYGCDQIDNGPQVPDPSDYGDVEQGLLPTTPHRLPQLPPVEIGLTAGDQVNLFAGVFYDSLISSPSFRSKTVTLVAGQAYYFVPGNCTALQRMSGFSVVESYSSEGTFIAGGTAYTLVGPYYTDTLPEAPLAITTVLAAQPVVTLRITAFPQARIRFTLDTAGGTPAKPSFDYPGSLVTGMDYDGVLGRWVPIAIPIGTTTANLKAVGRLAGYSDSPVQTDNMSF